MNKLIYIMTFEVLFSCNSKTRNNERIESKVVQGTVVVKEKLVDTVFIEKRDEDNFTTSDFYIRERLPEWFLETDLLSGLKLKSEYEFDNRLNPLYLEEDFNGDGNLDIAFPIKQTKTQKVGFAIIHGQSNNVFIIGAGKEIKNGLSDDMNYIDIWKINRQRINEPGLNKNGEVDKNGSLILDNPSLQVEKSEVGGGQIYWNGKEYIYFHQTC